MVTARLRNAVLTTMLAGALASGAACSGAKNTEIIVAVQTDMRVPKDLDAITLRVLSRGAVQHEETHVLGPFALRLPATIGLVPADADDLQPIEVQVIGRFSKDPQVEPALRDERVLRKARMTFARGRVGMVRLPLKFSCYDVTDCKEAETCIAGACVPTPLIEGTSMPDYRAEAVFGPGGNEQQQGTCFDGQSCLSSALPLPATDDPCVYAFPDAAAPRRLDPTLPINVALTTGPGGLGFCDATACRIPLDLDPLEGWGWADETRTKIRIAQGLCAKVSASKGALRVEASDACATKTPDVPLCAEAPGDAGQDTSVADAGPDESVDTTVVDAGETDATTPDTLVADGGALDSTLPDTTVTDTTVPDTTVPDTTPPDTTVPDTTVADTMVADTMVDTGVTDSAPPDTGPPDTCVPMTCTDLGADCGNPSDGCGGTLSCGTCMGGWTCASFVCTPVADAGDDAFVDDTFVPDTFVPDTWVEDTWVEDTWVPEDTWVEDTWVDDTWVGDTFITPDVALGG